MAAVATQVQDKSQPVHRLGSDKMWRARTRDGNRGSLEEATGAASAAPPARRHPSSGQLIVSCSLAKVAWYGCTRHPE